MNSFSLGWIPLLPLLGALFAGLIGAKLPKRLVGFICSGMVALAFFLALGGVFKLLVISSEPTSVGLANAVGLDSWISEGTVLTESLARAQDSSMTSIALSGKKRSFM